MCSFLNAYPLFVVGDDAANKVGVGVSQRGHQLGQLLLVQLPHSAEHALLGLVGGAERRLVHPGNLVQTHDSINLAVGGGGGKRKEGGRNGLTQGQTRNSRRWYDADVVVQVKASFNGVERIGLFRSVSKI